jgi:hypothetical protein
LAARKISMTDEEYDIALRLVGQDATRGLGTTYNIAKS